MTIKKSGYETSIWKGILRSPRVILDSPETLNQLGEKLPHKSIISVSNVKKIYKLGDVEVHALDGVSFDIFEGEIVFVLGPSGSGKTTLLNLIGGIDSISEGEIIVCDDTLRTLTAKQLTKYRKQRLAFVFQFYSLIPTLTVIENVELTMELMKFPQKTIRKEAKKFIEMVGLKDRQNNFPSQLSGGERQRVAIARALAKDPDILLVDEPTGQLDQDSGVKIVELIRRIAKDQNKTVLLVTHDIEIHKFADRVIKLRSGKIISDQYIEGGVPVESNL